MNLGINNRTEFLYRQWGTLIGTNPNNRAVWDSTHLHNVQSGIEYCPIDGRYSHTSDSKSLTLTTCRVGADYRSKISQNI